ncbi:hypothetical protein HC256_007728 [Beauveria bassiana]|nr:hypothetical protein HC256_007728 [Beauveria bassiana]
MNPVASLFGLANLVSEPGLHPHFGLHVGGKLHTSKIYRPPYHITHLISFNIILVTRYCQYSTLSPKPYSCLILQLRRLAARRSATQSWLAACYRRKNRGRHGTFKLSPSTPHIKLMTGGIRYEYTMLLR